MDRMDRVDGVSNSVACCKGSVVCAKLAPRSIEPTLPLIFAAYEKRLLAAWPKKGASLLQEAKLLPPTENQQKDFDSMSSGY